MDKETLKDVYERRETNLLVFEHLKEKCPEFVGWAKRLLFRSNDLIDFAEMSYHSEWNTFRIKVYTNCYSYLIAVQPPTEEKPKGFLCISTSRRGKECCAYKTPVCDLADGEYCVEVWNKALSDILWNELVRFGE